MKYCHPKLGVCGRHRQVTLVGTNNLNYKGDSPRADTKIQSLFLPKGSNPDTFKEEKACCKKICVRPGAAGLLTDIECSRVRDSSWMYFTSFVTIRIGVELAAVQRKLPDCVVVGLQLYSVRTFHVILSPRIYKGGQGPPPNDHQHLRKYKPLHRT